MNFADGIDGGRAGRGSKVAVVTRAQFLRGDWAGRGQVAELDRHARVQIGTACLAWQGVLCQQCAEACEVAAIRLRPRLGEAPTPKIDPSACNGCGDCLPACPAAAIGLVGASR